MEVGYFLDEKREYIIENMQPVRPLKNFLWNDTTFVEVNQFGFGTTKCCINQDFRPLVNDVRLFYIKDKESTIFRPEKELKGFKKVFLKYGIEADPVFDRYVPVYPWQ